MPDSVEIARVIAFELDGKTDKFAVVKFTGTECLSSLFSYSVSLSSTAPFLDFDDFLEAKAHLSFGDPAVHIHGMVCSVQQGYDATWKDGTGMVTRVDIVLVPNLWKLTLNVRTRFFENVELKDIIKKVLAEYSITPKIDFTAAHPKRLSVLQYQESDLHFIQRLCEREGVHYHFVHGESEEDVVFSDDNKTFDPIQAPVDLPLRAPVNTRGGGMLGSWSEEKTVARFQSRQRFMPKKVVLQDYNYMEPSKNLMVEGEAPGRASEGVWYSYGDNYKDTGEGEVLRDFRKEDILARKRLYFGGSNAYFLYAGGAFKVIDTGDANTALAQEYVVTEIQVEGSQPRGARSQDEKYHYANTFTCIPKDVAYRPPLKTAWPVMNGTFEAKIIASGQYADVEKQGRYRIKFAFDYDDTGCPIPVRRLQPYVGASYGFHAPLHEDVEVAVAFENGDPDRPVILAAAHNPDHPDTVVDGNHVQSVWRSAGNNEFMMDDTSGSEKFYQHCEKDLEIKTENDKKEYTGHDENLEVKNDRTRKVGNNEKVEVVKNRNKKVGADEVTEIGANRKVEIKADSTETVKANKTVTVEGTHTEKVVKDLTYEAQAKSNFKFVGDQKHLIEGTLTNTVNGKVTTTIKAARKEDVSGDDELTVGGDLKRTVKGEVKYEVSKDFTVDGKGDITLDAGFLKGVTCKGLKVELEGMKEISISSKNKVSIEGKASGVEISGSKYEVKADGEVSVKGATIKLN